MARRSKRKRGRNPKTAMVCPKTAHGGKKVHVAKNGNCYVVFKKAGARSVSKVCATSAKAMRPGRKKKRKSRRRRR